MKRRLRTTAVAAIAVIPWLPAVAPGGNVASGGKAGSTTAMATKGSSMRPHRGLSVVRGFGGFCCFGSTHFDDASFLIVDATPAEAQVFLDGRFLGTWKPTATKDGVRLEIRLRRALTPPQKRELQRAVVAYGEFVGKPISTNPVSYTHLTLPTILRV